MIKDYISIAVKSLTKRKIRSWLTLLGIFIGIAAVVSLISLGAGLKLAVANQFNILGAERITIQAKGITAGPPGTNVANPLTEDELKIIQRINGVEVAAGRIIQSTTATLDKKSYTAYVGSMPNDLAERAWVNEVASVEIEKGRDLRSSDKYNIVVGNNYHEKQRFGRNLNIRDTIVIQGIKFEVVGILKRQGSFIADNIIIMNEDVMREIYDVNGRYSLIVAKAASLDEIDIVIERMQRELRKARGNLKEGKEDFTVETNTQAFESIAETLDIVTVLLSGIAAISLIVGGIGIMNTMYTSVLERQQEIGIMKAIGARNSDIFRIFFIESGILGLVGGIIGVLLGVGIAKLVEFIGGLFLGVGLLQASFSPMLIIGALLFSFIVGAAAGTLPAIGAANQSPVDALRD